jgi:voltage-gated potassium channel|tara:strand:- start:90 stop:290 length:201 start_codon:yes stop_codon:yes gene_type:complete
MLPKEEFGFKSVIDPFYFSFTTMSTVGYGDISPKSDRAKLIVMTQQAALLVELSSMFKTMFVLKNK